MSQAGMLGLRHLALNVQDLQASQRFYEKFVGMKVLWQPDSDSVYLSSGSDNLALHQISEEKMSSYPNQEGQFLDHLGFLIDTPANVDGLFQQFQADGVSIVKPLKQHRDGSYSFYVADPDGNVVQILYEPTVSQTK